MPLSNFKINASRDIQKYNTSCCVARFELHMRFISLHGKASYPPERYTRKIYLYTRSFTPSTPTHDRMRIPSV